MLVLGGPAALLAAAGLALRFTSGGSAPVRRLAAALLTVAGGLLGGLVHQLLPPDGASWAGGWAWTVLWGVTTLAWAGGYAALRGGLLHAAVLSGLAVTAGVAADHLAGPEAYEHHWEALAIGGSVVAVGAVWAALVAFRVIRERALGLTLAAVVTFIGSEHMHSGWPGEHAWPGYAVTGLLAVLGLAGYVRTRIVGLLVVGVVALATVVPEAVLDYTDGALGTAGGLLVAGLSIVAASAVGFRLRREVISQD